MIPLQWHADGLCKEFPGVDFFSTTKKGVSEAVAVCNRCLVREECLAWAVAQPPPLHGVWGGATEQELRRMRNNRAA